MADNIKLVFTYIIASVIVVGGGLMLFFTRNDPVEQVGSLQLVISGFMGAAIQFVFNRETQTQTARSTERAMSSSPR